MQCETLIDVNFMFFLPGYFFVNEKKDDQLIKSELDNGKIALLEKYPQQQMPTINEKNVI